MRRATLATIAAAAGVSLPTVSKVLNGKDDVGPETRARVRRLLAEYDYVPVGARRASGQLLVDLVFTALDSPWAVEIIRGVVDSGLHVVVSSAAGQRGHSSWAASLVDAKRAGALLVTSQLTAADRRVLAGSRIPVVVIDPVDLPNPDVPSVGATNWAGGLAATEHLIRLGHQRVAVIGGPAGMLCSRARVDGYRAALDRAGLPFDPGLVRHGDFKHEGGFRCATELLRLPDRPTAVFAGNDEQALGVIEAARVAGLSVPNDLSVVGFDDLPVAVWSSPALTTVRQPLTEMGRHAGRMLADLIAGRPVETERVELATELVVRSSTKEPPCT
ncbi:MULTISPECIES: LacI family DNA-binding transcriptional regulator [Saccharothrix]|jgi:LacI family transcriptional regulator|uniref:LacI family transcriptional regulator n=1 Tax=Saccharothrix variisporea TaxID=543527 RepID=A0A495X449_9PSEU|nr:LacI family DNA-binding transcriptional regulator [Saccharothrix variisporea]NUT99936.1 LacI family transcriptional regulator [Saccharothrix sp.]RKT68730.1 LacI family transcriptional regulator [Saccharothrix variisporea]